MCLVCSARDEPNATPERSAMFMLAALATAPDDEWVEAHLCDLHQRALLAVLSLARRSREPR